MRCSDDEIQLDAIRLLQLIRETLDLRDLESGSSRSGLLPGQIFALGRRLGWPDIKISALFDVLIDDAKVSPKVDEFGTDGEILARTYNIDGEMVSDLVRRFTRMWGLPRGPE